MGKLLFILTFFYSTLLYAQTPVETDWKSKKNDLDFLQSIIGEKRIVCLGEEWHGNETFNSLKNRVVKYLHREMDFDVVLFESSIYGGLIVSENHLKGKEQLFELLPHIWRTQSLLDLVLYSDSTALHLAGMDVGGAYSSSFSSYLKDCFSSNSNKSEDSIFKTDSLLQARWVKWQSTFDQNSGLSIDEASFYASFYNELINQLTNEKPYATLNDKPFLIQCLKNRIKLAELLAIKGSTKGFRDKVMSQNLEYFIQEKFKGKKIIIWAAHIHISKSLKDTYPSKKVTPSMVELLPSSILDQLVAIDFKPFKSAPKKLRKKLKQTQKEALFYDLSPPTKNEVDLTTLSKQFDAVFFCRKYAPIEQFKVIP